MSTSPKTILTVLEKQRPDIELLRSKLMMGILGGSLLVFFIYALLGRHELQVFMKDERSVYAVVGLVALSLLLEFFVFLRVKYYWARKKGIPRLPLVLFTFLEISFPTIIILTVCYVDHSGSALDSPAFAAIFLILMLSTLHLDARLSLVVGIFAAVDHLIMSAWVIHVIAADVPETIALPFGVYVFRSLAIFAGGLVASFVAAQLRKRMINSIEAMEEKQNVQRLFGEQVSPEVVATLMDDNRPQQEVGEASIMFLDIRNFTAYAGTISPEELITYQNKIFSPLLHIIHDYDGIVNQILGDGFMASFGIPNRNNSHAMNAYRAGQAILKEIKRLSDTGAIPPTQVGIGLHSGSVVTGNIGNTVRKQFSIAGTNVNFAARLEQLNKRLGTQYLISPAVATQLPEKEAALLKPVDGQLLKGFADPVRVYVVPGPN